MAVKDADKIIYWEADDTHLIADATCYIVFRKTPCSWFEQQDITTNWNEQQDLPTNWTNETDIC